MSTELKKALNSQIDSLIDELFGEEEVQKSDMIKEQKPEKETADEAMKEVPGSQDDASRGAGRPEQISDVPKIDQDGKRAKKYDEAIASKESNEDAKKKEDNQVEVPEQMKKAWKDAEYAEYQELKKAKEAAQEAETLKKARQETADLVKSVIGEATQGIKKENDELKKAIKEQGDLIKAMANKPQKSKAVTNVQAVEKFQKSQTNSLSKAEVLDVAEDLVKSKKLTMEHAIELENTGFIYDPEARDILDREVRRRYS